MQYIHLLILLSFFFLVPTASAQRVFQNQMHVFGGDVQARIRHAKQMGYDYVLGQPWSKDVARMESEAGLGVLFNSTAGDEAKWLRFNNPGGVGSTTSPTKVNGLSIPSHFYEEFTKAFCMKNVAAANTDLKNKYHIASQYETGEVVLFDNNYRCSSGIDAMVRHNEWLYNLHGGSLYHNGVFLDQVNHHPLALIGQCINPCISDPNEIVYPDHATGQIEFMKRIRQRFQIELGLDGVSGNPWNVRKYNDRQSILQFGLIYNESGVENNPGIWDATLRPVSAVHIKQTATYSEALLALGPAGLHGSWFGWYGEGQFPNGATNATELARAIPNWDNLIGATGRVWNVTTQTYMSSNSYADPKVIYGRHPKTGKIFAVFQNTAGVLNLRQGETVVDIQAVDNLFIETGSSPSSLSISNTTVTLTDTTKIGKGFILTAQTAGVVVPATPGKVQVEISPL